MTHAKTHELEEDRVQSLSPEQIRERLAEYEEAGIQELIVRFVDAAQLEPVRLLRGSVYNDASKASWMTNLCENGESSSIFWRKLSDIETLV